MVDKRCAPGSLLDLDNEFEEAPAAEAPPKQRRRSQPGYSPSSAASGPAVPLPGTSTRVAEACSSLMAGDLSPRSQRLVSAINLSVQAQITPLSTQIAGLSGQLAVMGNSLGNLDKTVQDHGSHF